MLGKEKKTNLVPVYKEEDKTICKTLLASFNLASGVEYQILSVFFQLWGLSFFFRAIWFFSNQFSFQVGRFCMDQLVFTTHRIQKDFFDRFNGKDNFLRFHKCYRGYRQKLILQWWGVRKNSNLILTLLIHREQRAVLNCENIFWTYVNAGVPQGSTRFRKNKLASDLWKGILMFSICSV